MKLEDDQTPGTRPERPWLSWSAINTLYFPFLAILLSSHLCSLLLPPGCRLNRLDRSACEDQLTMNHHCLAQAQTGGLQKNSPGKSSIASQNFICLNNKMEGEGGSQNLSLRTFYIYWSIWSLCILIKLLYLLPCTFCIQATLIFGIFLDFIIYSYMEQQIFNSFSKRLLYIQGSGVVDIQ